MLETKSEVIWQSAGNHMRETHVAPQRPHAMLQHRLDEDMVQCRKETLSEIPCRVSSDAHEWCNDWATVSGSSSVKTQYR